MSTVSFLRKVLTGYAESDTNNLYKQGNNSGGNVVVKYRKASDISHAQETLSLAEINIDLTPGFAESIVQGSVRFEVGGRTYVDRSGQLYYDINPNTGAATLGGTVDYASGEAILSAWVTGSGSSMSLKSLLTTMNYHPVDQVVFRSPVAPVKVGTFSVRAVSAETGDIITASADNTGRILSATMDGYFEHETGVANIKFGEWIVASGYQAEWWYNANAVREDGKIFKPYHVFADTITFNAVGYTYLPLSSEILGLNPVRLPADGKIPIYQSGDVVVILQDNVTQGTFSSNSTTTLSSNSLAKLTVRDAGGNMIDSAKYAVNLDTGVISWGDLSLVSQPLSIIARIEDMAVVTDVQLPGILSLSQPISHNFDHTKAIVSNAVIYGDLFARTSIPFDQQTWTNVWSDVLIGSSTSAQFNHSQYPIVVDNASCITERWMVYFTNANTINIVGENVGQIATGLSIDSDIAPLNPNTNQPYFTINHSGFGAGWSAGNVLRFNTFGAGAPVWALMSVAQGDAVSDDYRFCLEFRGDVDAV